MYMYLFLWSSTSFSLASISYIHTHNLLYQTVNQLVSLYDQQVHVPHVYHKATVCTQEKNENRSSHLGGRITACREKSYP